MLHAKNEEMFVVNFTKKTEENTMKSWHEKSY